ncbi:fibronectin type III domain-containing protein [Chryseobacterium echinoideorum]|uniref:fibronectin type III domain-containing protein n=1 Tax=Chryseobacterium echinoideorum TaxID=1549648 RepID=UPI0011853CE8|nr:fibronectin type III domain-containing protein [Chryseobacterium echinoideorum]
MKIFYKKPQQWIRGLQKLGIPILMLFGAAQGLDAQVSSYSFSQNTGSFTSISGTGTLVTGSEATTSTTNDTTGWSVTLPFTFNFNGTDYTSMYVNSNGGAIFGTTTSSASTVISSSTAYGGAVGVMNRDLWGVFITSGVTTSGSNVITNVASFQGIAVGKALNNVNGIPTNATITAFDEVAGTITMSAPATSSSSSAVVRYGSGKVFTSTIGSAPNRVFVIEWIGYNDYSTSVTGSNHLNFQLRLAETTNIISTVYGPSYNVNTTVRTNEIGLRGATNSDFNNRSGSSTTAWNATLSGTTNSASVSRDNVNFPASGLTFTWTPPVPCTGTPTAGTVSPSSQTLVSGQTPAMLSLSGYSSGALGLSFQWQQSPDNSSWSNVTAGTGATTTFYTPVAFAGTTMYYRCVVTCTNSSQSANSDSVVVNPCGSSATFSENFDSLNPSTTPLPSCWAKVGTTGSLYAQASTAISSPNNLYIYSSSATSIAMVSMPPLNTLQSGNYRLRFKARSNSTSGGVVQVGYLTDPADQATFTSLQSFTTTSTSTVNNFVINNITAPSGVTTLAFRHTGSPAYSVLIDDVIYELMPSCSEPSAVTITTSSITSNGATVSWTAPNTVPANGYEVYYSTSNVAPTTTTVLDATNSVVSTTTSAPISGLTANTMYYVWVRSVCSSSDKSVWSLLSASFTTTCIAINAPYTENFDSTAVGSSTNTNAPNCWKYLEPANWAGYGYVSTTAFTSAPNGYYIYSDAASTGGGMLVSPPTTNLMSGNYRVKFSANGGGANYTMEVGTLSDPNDASTFVAIGTGISLTTTMTQYTVNIPSGTNQYLAFRHAGGGTYRSIRLDDIIVEQLPSCVEPTLITTSNITANGVTIAWTAPPTVPSNGYEVYYSTSNVAPTATTVLDATNSVVSTTTSAPVSGLTANTTYYVWVRSVCSSSDKSGWSTSASFTTACSVFVPNYTNDFSTFPGACWTLANGGTPASGPGTGTTNYWVEDGFLNNTTAGAARINLYSNNRAGWLISPTFNLTAGGYQVKFDYGITAYTGTASSAMGSDDIVNVLMSTDNGTTWTVIETWNANNAPSNTNNTFVYPVTSTSNQVKFAVYGSDGTVDDSEDYNFYVDNFVVETIPTCAEPTALNSNTITSNGATVSWTASVSAPNSGYSVYVATTNTAPTASTTPTYTNVTGTSQVVPGTAGATYYVWVRSECTSTLSSAWAGPVTYTIPFPAPANDECSGAIALTPGANFAQNAITSTNVGATTDVASSCATSNAVSNVWFSVVVPASGSITVETGAVTGSQFTDSVLTLFSGTCGSLTAISCNDDITSGSNIFSRVSLTGRTPGEVIYASVYRYSTNGSNGEIQVSAYDASLSTSEIVKTKNDIKIYPNPFSDVLNISDIKNVKSISVMDIAGRLVKSFEKPTTSLQLSELNSGMYLVVLNMNDGTKQTLKAIKK